MIVLMWCVQGCTTSTHADSFCVWAHPITITDKELNTLSEYTLREIDNYNQNYEKLCIKGT